MKSDSFHFIPKSKPRIRIQYSVSKNGKGNYWFYSGSDIVGHWYEGSRIFFKHFENGESELVWLS
jgi:hypothetical protein